MRTVLIIFRRLWALVLVLLFVPLFIVAVVAFRVNATVLDANFYVGTLQKDVYNFLYDDALPVLLQEADVNVHDLGAGISLTNEQVVGYAKRVVPPQWLQEQVEGAIRQAVPYAVGQREEFSITIRLDDRVTAAAEVAKEIGRDSGLYNYVLDEVVRPELEASGALEGLPFGLSLTSDQVIEGVREVVPEDWLLERVDEVVDAVVPYITGQSESFQVVVPVQDRSKIALKVLERWLQQSIEGGAYDYLLRQQIAPFLQQQLGAQTQLPLGMTLTHQEILDAVAQVLPREWVSARIADAFDAVGPYLIGETDAFVLEIPLRDRMQLAAPLLVGLVDAQFQQLYNSLPECTLQQLATLELSLDRIPPCRPPGVSVGSLKGLLGLDVLAQLQGRLVDQVPASFAFTEKDLEGALGQAVPLQDARGFLRDGLSFTHEDLRQLVLDASGQGNLDLLDDTRRVLREGYTVDHEDLRKLLKEDYADFQQVRDGLSAFKRWLFLTLVVPLMLAAAIGFLGGRTWWSRLGWAGVPLVISGVVVMVSVVVGGGLLKQFSDDPIRKLTLDPVFIAKLLEARDVLTEAVLGPMLTQGAVVLLVGAVMVGLGIYRSLTTQSQPAAARARRRR